MVENKLVVEKRVPGKKTVKAVRNSGSIPVEIYGTCLDENISGSVERRDLVKLFSTEFGKNIVLDLDCEGKSVKAVAHKLQIHPVKNCIQHIDFLAVREDEQVVVTVPVKRVGKSKGEVIGGKVFQVMKEIKVSAKPADIPANIVVDVTEAMIGDRIKLSELSYPEGVKPVFKQDTPVIVINKGRGMKTADLQG